MAVHKEGIRKQFCMIPMEYLMNNSLSLKELGLLVKIYALPEDWNFSLEGLAKTLECGVSQIRGAFKSLLVKGYIKTIRVRGPDGRFIRTDLYVLIDPKIPAVPYADSPRVEKPQEGKPLEGKRSAGKREEEKPHSEKPPDEEPPEENRRESIYKESKNKESIIKESKMKRSIGSSTKRSSVRKNSFNNFEQRNYNYDILEKQLMRAQGMTADADVTDRDDGTEASEPDNISEKQLCQNLTVRETEGEVMEGV